MTAADVTPGCPKRMVFGPCGGVRADHSCELGGLQCPFADSPLVTWEAPPRWQPLEITHQQPMVVTDLTVKPYDVTSVRGIVEILAPAADALLVGEHQNRPDLPPAVMAAEITRAGGNPWITLTCRDRNRIVLEQEVVGLAAIGVGAVLCATGDARGQGIRPDVTQVFDLDGTRLAALVRDRGLTVAVPESPESPPTSLRPQRVANKERAGAQICVLNHCRSATAVADFVAAARAAGATLPFVASVAIFTDDNSAQVLARFPGLHLDSGTVEQVLTASDPVERGIDVAVAESRRLLDIDGVVGVNVSGLASSTGLERAAEIKAELGRRIRAAAL